MIYINKVHAQLRSTFSPSPQEREKKKNIQRNALYRQVQNCFASCFPWNFKNNEWLNGHLKIKIDSQPRSGKPISLFRLLCLPDCEIRYSLCTSLEVYFIHRHIIRWGWKELSSWHKKRERKIIKEIQLLDFSAGCAAELQNLGKIHVAWYLQLGPFQYGGNRKIKCKISFKISLKTYPTHTLFHSHSVHTEDSAHSFVGTHCIFKHELNRLTE